MGGGQGAGFGVRLTYVQILAPTSLSPFPLNS